jgi:mannose-6-phosphate isomerase-like protein (cupin superfamily)
MPASRLGDAPMDDTTNCTRGYLIRRPEEAPTVPCPCGSSTRFLTRADGPELNVHVTFIKDSVRHYHLRCTEVYYILEGHGSLELNDDEVEVSPGMLVRIDPGTRHRLRSEEGVRTMVIGSPALDPEDEYFDA